jgi:hypothetical protein
MLKHNNQRIQEINSLKCKLRDSGLDANDESVKQIVDLLDMYLSNGKFCKRTIDIVDSKKRIQLKLSPIKSVVNELIITEIP